MKRAVWGLLALFLMACTPWVDAPGVFSPRTVAGPATQQVIDAGNVVNWSGNWPGEGGTVHLAGHRSTHGSTFRSVPNLDPGELVRVGYGGRVFHYRVTARRLVSASSNTRDVIYGDLVLQTSAPNHQVYLVYADLIY